MILESLREEAWQLDEKDPLAEFRAAFHIPHLNDKEVIYFTGNSLGLMPRSVPEYLQQELDDWANCGVEGHLHARRPWLSYHENFPGLLSPLIGAAESEIVVMNQLTVNLHLLMVSFYRPSATRFKILCEGRAFSSDQYAMESQVRFHGFDPNQAIVEVFPREGESTIRNEDLLDAIRREGNALALILLGGVNYYTGQLFDMPAVTKAGHSVGAVVGFDLAHAIGNVRLNLHEWGADFATWCSYKYLNSGPGGVSGVFIHERHHSADLPRFNGWWGNQKSDRFQMKKDFVPIQTAEAWQLSNAPVLSMAAHLASLELFQRAGMERLHAKRERMADLMVRGLKKLQSEYPNRFTVLTPDDPNARGCQTSLYFPAQGKVVFDALEKAGVVSDWREPGVIRVAPVPLYNRFEEVVSFIELLHAILKSHMS